jgi:cell division protein FtsQ
VKAKDASRGRWSGEKMTGNDENESRRPFLTAAKICIVVAVISVFAWNFFVWYKSNNFDIEKIRVVTTSEHVKPQVLQNIILAHLKKNFFSVDLANLRQQILSLAWVYSVTIKRRWPNILIVDVEEQKPIAQWKDEALLNSSGNLFTPPKDTFPSDLPLLFGPEEEVNQIVKNYLEVRDVLSSVKFNITQLIVDEKSVWHIILNNRVDLWAKGEDVLDNVRTFVAAYSKIIAGKNIDDLKVIDLRYKSGVAIKWDEHKPTK